MDQIPSSIQNPVDLVRSVAAPLSHPDSIRLRGYARDLHSSGGQIQEEQDQKAFQTSGSPHLDSEKIRCRNQFPVLRQKLFPSRFSVALRSWFDTVPAQNVSDSATRYRIPQIRYRTLNSTIAPGSVLFRHSDDEILPFFTRAWPAGNTLLVAVVLLGNQLP